jgi:two-component system LytT family sensor kinase
VRDDGRGLAGPHRERQGTGNTRVRLAQLYGDAGRFELRPAAGGGAEAVVTIPFRETGDPARPALPADGEDAAPDPSAATVAGPSGRRFPLDPDRRAGLRRAVAMTAATWGFWAAFWSAQAWALHVVNGNQPVWHRLLYFNVGNALLWAALTLPVAAAVRRWPARGERAWARAALHVVFALLAASLLAVARWQIFFPERPFVAPGLPGWLAWDAITYAAVAAFAQGSFLAARRRARETQVASLESDLARAELDVLKWQLRPAFLVETLDDVAAAAARDPERADELTTRLGDLLRAMLQHVGSDEAPLSRELEMAEAYLDVQRLRAPDRLATEIVVDSLASEARVPGMLLLPLAEELIPSMVQASPAQSAPSQSAPLQSAPLRVRIEVRRRGARLEIVALGTPSASGIPSPGIERLRARLHAAYGDAQRVTESATPSGMRRVTIELPVLVIEERPAPSYLPGMRVGVPA